MMSLHRVAAMLAAAALACALVWAPGRAVAEDVGLLPSGLGLSEAYTSDKRSGAALFGYDPVSFLTDPAPRTGQPAFETVRDGVVWRFATAGNKAAFLRTPEAFLPRVGGYDAAALARGLVVESNPRFYVVRDGRLYFFRSAESRAAFLREGGIAAEAERQWPELRETLVRE